MPEDILNIRAFVRNQSASSLMQMMQNNHAIDIALQEAEPILNVINVNNSTIHHNQDSVKVQFVWRCYYVCYNDPMLLALDNSDSPSI